MCTLRDHPLFVVGAFVCLFHLESYPSWSLALLVGSPPSCGGGLCLPLSPGELSKLESCTPCGITPFLWWGPLFASFTWRAIQAGVLHSLWDHPLLVVEAFVCLFHLESYPSWSLALLVGSPPSCGGGLCLPLSPGELSKLESCTPCGITPFLWWRPLFASFTWRAIQAGVLHSLWDHPLLVVEAFVCFFHLESYPSWSLALLVGSPPSCGGGLCLPLSPGELSKLESCTSLGSPMLDRPDKEWSLALQAS